MGYSRLVVVVMVPHDDDATDVAIVFDDLLKFVLVDHHLHQSLVLQPELDYMVALVLVKKKIIF